MERSKKASDGRTSEYARQKIEASYGWPEDSSIREWPQFRKEHQIWTDAAKHFKMSAKLSILLSSKPNFE